MAPRLPARGRRYNKELADKLLKSWHSRHAAVEGGTVIVELKSVRRDVVAREIQLVNDAEGVTNPPSPRVGVVPNLGERKLEAKRKLKSFRKDKQDSQNPVYPVIPSKKYVTESMNKSAEVVFPSK